MCDWKGWNAGVLGVMELSCILSVVVLTQICTFKIHKLYTLHNISFTLSGRKQLTMKRTHYGQHTSKILNLSMLMTVNYNDCSVLYHVHRAGGHLICIPFFPVTNNATSSILCTSPQACVQE